MEKMFVAYMSMADGYVIDRYVISLWPIGIATTNLLIVYLSVTYLLATFSSPSRLENILQSLFLVNLAPFGAQSAEFYSLTTQHIVPALFRRSQLGWRNILSIQ